VVNEVHRGDVVLVRLGHGTGGEMRKTRPCVVVSPDVLNQLPTLIVLPLTSGGHAYPFRIPCRFQGKSGYVVVDQVRTIDRNRAVKRLGRISPRTLSSVLDALGEMFAP
jgi:mRNA interferase MazF